MDIFLSPVNGHVDSVGPVEQVLRQILQAVAIQTDYLQSGEAFEDIFF